MSVLRRLVSAAAVLACVVALAGTPTAQIEPTAVVRNFEQGYNAQVYGNFTQAGNGNMRCPRAGYPVDPGGEPIAGCPGVQAGSALAQKQTNDTYYMRYADVDSDPDTFNSSTAALTVPPDAKVVFARLNWAGDTGRIRADDNTIASGTACNTRQFRAGAGAAKLPAGSPDSTPVSLDVGGSRTSVTPGTYTVDTDDDLPAANPQYYSAYTDAALPGGR